MTTIYGSGDVPSGISIFAAYGTQKLFSSAKGIPIIPIIDIDNAFSSYIHYYPLNKSQSIMIKYAVLAEQSIFFDPYPLNPTL